MSTPTASFSPDELLGTPLSPILEHDALPQTNPPGIHDTDSTVFVGQFGNWPYRRESHPSKVVTRDFATQPTTTGEEQSEYAVGRQPSDILPKLPRSDKDNTDSQTNRRMSLPETSTTAKSSTDDLGTSLSRQESGVSECSHQAVVGWNRRLDSPVFFVVPVPSSDSSLLKTPRGKVKQMRKAYREKRAQGKESAKTSSRFYSASKADNVTQSRESSQPSVWLNKPVPSSGNAESGGDGSGTRERKHTIDRIKDRIRHRRRSVEKSVEKSPDMDASYMLPVNEKMEELR